MLLFVVTSSIKNSGWTLFSQQGQKPVQNKSTFIQIHLIGKRWAFKFHTKFQK